jgi:hypothetical protein
MLPVSSVTTQAHAALTPALGAAAFAILTHLVKVTACRPTFAGLQMLATLMRIACSVVFVLRLAVGRFVPIRTRIYATLCRSGISVHVVYGRGWIVMMSARNLSNAVEKTRQMLGRNANYASNKDAISTSLRVDCLTHFTSGYPDSFVYRT